MKKSTFIIILVLVALMSLVFMACSDKDDPHGANTRTAVNLTSTIPRVVDQSWHAGDAVGLIMLYADNTVAGDRVNYKYATSQGDGIFTPVDKENTAYYPTNGKTVDIFGYYPHTTNMDANLMVPVSTAIQTNLPEIDLMGSNRSTGHSNENANVALTFSHKLAKLSITVDRKESASDLDLTGATLIIKGTASSAKWSLLENKLVDIADKAADISIPVTQDANGNLKATAIVLPTDAGKGVTFVLTTATGNEYVAPIDSSTVLASGTNNKFRIHVDYTGAKLSVTIDDWVDGVDVDINALQIVPSATDGSAVGINSLSVWTTFNADSKAIYTFTDEKWISATPYYIDTLTGSEEFFARHNPDESSKDTISELVDVLGNTTAANYKEGKVCFTLTHLLSKLNISLIKGVNFAPDIDLKGAKIELAGFKKEVSISDANVVTATGDSSAYTLTVDDAANASILVVPQTIPAGTAFKVTLMNGNGNSYTATLANAFVLGTGKIQTLTLTLDFTATKIGISVTEWDTADGASQDVTIDNISTDGATGDFTETDGTLAIKSSEQTANYTYSTANSSWISASPLYWDSFSKGTHTFYALFTPTAAGTPEKNYLTGSTSVPFGKAIQFTGASSLTHAMSQISIKLVDKDNSGIVAKLTEKQLNLKALKSITLEGAISLADAVTANQFTAETVYTVAPQTLTDAHTIVLTEPTLGNKYTVKLSDIKVDGSAISALSAGKSYNITLNLSNSALSVSASLKDWDELNGSGEAAPDNGN